MVAWVVVLVYTILSSGTVLAASVSGGGGGGGGTTGWPTILSGSAATSEVAGESVSIRGKGAQLNNGADLYQGSDGVFTWVCVVANVRNDCDYIRKLATGKKYEILNSSNAPILTLSNATGALTNVKIDAEGTGNILTIKDYKYYAFAGCNAGTASTIWDLPSSNAPAPACKGTNYPKGVLEFADGATDLSAYIHDYLAEDWTGAIDATLIWESTSTSGNNVLWGIAIACAGPGDNSDPAFTDDDFTADANNGTANTYNATAVNTVTTTGTCIAGDVMHIRVKRRLSQAGDTLGATAQAIGLALKLRQAQ